MSRRLEQRCDGRGGKRKWGRHRCRPHSHRRVAPGGTWRPAFRKVEPRRSDHLCRPALAPASGLDPLRFGSEGRSLLPSRWVRFRSHPSVMVRRSDRFGAALRLCHFVRVGPEFRPDADEPFASFAAPHTGLQEPCTLEPLPAARPSPAYRSVRKFSAFSTLSDRLCRSSSPFDKPKVTRQRESFNRANGDFSTKRDLRGGQGWITPMTHRISLQSHVGPRNSRP